MEVGGATRRAQVAGGRVDRVDRVVRVGVAVARGVDAPALPRRGHELHPADGALTVRDLAKSWRVSDQTIYRLAAAQVIPHFRVAGSLRFDPKAIASWIRKRSVSGM